MRVAADVESALRPRASCVTGHIAKKRGGADLDQRLRSSTRLVGGDH